MISMGIIRINRSWGMISLNTTMHHTVASDNFKTMKDIIGASFSFANERLLSTNNRGTVLVKVISNINPAIIDEETKKRLKKSGFKIDF